METRYQKIAYKDSFPRKAKHVSRCILVSIILVITALTNAKLFAAEQTVIYQGQALFNTSVANWNKALDGFEMDVRRLTTQHGAENTLSKKIRATRKAASVQRAKATIAVIELQKLLNVIGLEPTADEYEDENVTADRSQLIKKSAHFTGRIKRCDVVITRAESLLTQLAHAEHKLLISQITHRSPLPLALSTMTIATQQGFSKLGAIVMRGQQYIHSIPTRFASKKRQPAIALLFTLAIAITWYSQRRLRQLKSISDPTFARKVRHGSFVFLLTGVAPALATIGLLLILHIDVDESVMNELRTGIGFSLILALITLGIARALLSPHHLPCQVSEFTEDAVQSLYRSIKRLTIVILVSDIVVYMVSGEGAISELEVVGIYLTNIAVVVAMFQLLRTKNWNFVTTDGSQKNITTSSKKVHIAIRLMQIVLVLALIAGVMGYTNLCDYLIKSIGWTLILLFVSLILRNLLSFLLRQHITPETMLGNLFSKLTILDFSSFPKAYFWAMLFFDFIFIVSALLVLLLIWGVSLTAIENFGFQYISGLSVGNWKFSYSDLFEALLAFFAVWLFFRLIKKILVSRVFQHTQFDIGVRDALTVGVGYLGITAASLVAFSTLGFDFGRLALILGALSVGIGFGLQHVVSNFVSGLILLIQRPVKAGDWIVVGQHQGYVKKVNATTTEIQTFDNASVILPNQFLVSSDVVNWTHKSKLGRVVVGVGVAYDSDVEAVTELLLQCVSDRDEVLQKPEPYVVFKNFGSSSLEFELLFYISEIDSVQRISSIVRYAIRASFIEAGISIPYPQQDLHIKSAPWSRKPFKPT